MSRCRAVAESVGLTASFVKEDCVPAASSIRRRPSSHEAECHRNQIAHINGEPEHFLGTATVFWVKELQLHIPTIAIQATEGTFLYRDAV